jgi:hypothetical protein
MPAPSSQQDAINAFINVANEMKNDGASIQFVSTALMRACAVYSTYVVAGNAGALRESGIDKLKELFAQELDVIQRAKLREAGLDPETGAQK